MVTITFSRNWEISLNLSYGKQTETPSGSSVSWLKLQASPTKQDHDSLGMSFPRLTSSEVTDFFKLERKKKRKKETVR